MASELIGIDMKRLCFEENEHLDQTEFTQIALLTTGMAMEQSIRACGLTPDVTAGLSLASTTRLCPPAVWKWRMR